MSKNTHYKRIVKNALRSKKYRVRKKNVKRVRTFSPEYKKYTSEVIAQYIAYRMSDCIKLCFNKKNV